MSELNNIKKKSHIAGFIGISHFQLKFILNDNLVEAVSHIDSLNIKNSISIFLVEEQCKKNGLVLESYKSAYDAAKQMAKHYSNVFDFLSELEISGKYENLREADNLFNSVNQAKTLSNSFIQRIVLLKSFKIFLKISKKKSRDLLNIIVEIHSRYSGIILAINNNFLKDCTILNDKIFNYLLIKNIDLKNVEMVDFLGNSQQYLKLYEK